MKKKDDDVWGLTPAYQLIVPALYKCKDYELEELSRYCLQIIRYRKNQ